MHMKDQLIATIAKQLNIPKIADTEWICHAIYSVAGKMAMASLWDHEEDRSFISPQHFKQRIKQVYEAYSSIYPQVNHLLPEDRDELANHIYATFLRAGHFYHKANRLYPATSVMSQVDRVALYRGVAPDEKLFMSGLGFYSISPGAKETLSVAEMYNLQSQTMNAYLDELLNLGDWIPAEWPDNAEFLRLAPPFSKGYWHETLCTDGRISLARYGEPNKLYAFYKSEKGQMLQKPIPDWRTKDFRSDSLNNHNDHGGYRRIAVALLDRYGTLPAIKAKLDKEIADVHLGYLLPPEEKDFFNLYSWPEGYFNSIRLFRGKMTIPLYLLFRQQLESIGYRFEEE